MFKPGDQIRVTKQGFYLGMLGTVVEPRSLQQPGELSVQGNDGRYYYFRPGDLELQEPLWATEEEIEERRNGICCGDCGRCTVEYGGIPVVETEMAPPDKIIFVDEAAFMPTKLLEEMRALISEEGPVTDIGRHPSSARFVEIMQGNIDLHDQKQKDYGSAGDPFANVRSSEAMGLPGWVGVIVRMGDKYKRCQAAVEQYLKSGNVLMANETLQDTFNDLAVYSAIAQVLYEEWLAESATVAEEAYSVRA